MKIALIACSEASVQFTNFFNVFNKYGGSGRQQGLRGQDQGLDEKWLDSCPGSTLSGPGPEESHLLRLTG